MPLPTGIYKCIEANKKRITVGVGAIANLESTRKNMAQGEYQKEKVTVSCVKALSEMISVEKANVQTNRQLGKSWAKLQDAFERPASASQQTHRVERGSDPETAVPANRSSAKHRGPPRNPKAPRTQNTPSGGETERRMAAMNIGR